MRDQVFISYSHEDEKLTKELLKHLKPFSRSRAITAWSDEQIASGSQWFSEIQTALGKTSVAVLLVSPDFLASDFIHEHELGPLLKEGESGGVKILWIPIRASAYEETPLKHYQAVLPPDKPLAQMSRADRDEAWVHVCKEIKSAIDSPEFTGALPASPQTTPPLSVPVKRVNEPHSADQTFGGAELVEENAADGKGALRPKQPYSASKRPQIILAFIAALTIIALAIFQRWHPSGVHRVEGDIRESVTGSPITGATLTLESSGKSQVSHSDSHGLFRFDLDGWPPLAILRAEEQGYESFSHSLDLSIDLPFQEIRLTRRLPSSPPKEQKKKPARKPIVFSSTNASQYSEGENVTQIQDRFYVVAVAPELRTRFFIPLTAAPGGISRATLFINYSCDRPASLRVAVVGTLAETAVEPTRRVTLPGQQGCGRNSQPIGNFDIQEGTNYVVVAADRGDQWPPINTFWFKY